MTVYYRVKKGQKPTEEQIAEIRQAALQVPVYDEDCPELTMEQMLRYREAARKKRERKVVSIEMSDVDYATAKSLGKGYRGILSRLLSSALKDQGLVQQAISNNA